MPKMLVPGGYQFTQLDEITSAFDKNRSTYFAVLTQHYAAWNPEHQPNRRALPNVSITPIVEHKASHTFCSHGRIIVVEELSQRLNQIQKLQLSRL